VFAPNDNQISKDASIPAEIYSEIFEYASKNYQLVIIDTQVLESISVHKKGIIKKQINTVNDLLVDFLSEKNAWVLGLGDGDNDESIKGLYDRLKGLRISRNLIVINNNDNVNKQMETDISTYLKPVGNIYGFVPHIKEIKSEMSKGNIPINIWQIRQITNTLLAKITGKPDFIQNLESKKSQEGYSIETKKGKTNLVGKVSQSLKGLFYG
jgi:hypothetical protein